MPPTSKPKKKKHYKQLPPDKEPDYRQQAFWDVQRAAEECASETYELHNAVTELGSIVTDLIAAIDNGATAIVEAIDEHTTAITERERERN